MSGFNQLPQNGVVVALVQNNQFVGRTRDPNQEIKIAPQLGEWEAFTVETEGNKVAFRQVVSGLYIGGHIRNDSTPHFVTKKDAWENFTLENRGNGTYVIRSVENTVLCLQNGDLKWRTNPHGNNDVWTFKTLQQANQGFQNNGSSGQGNLAGKLHGHITGWIDAFKTGFNSNSLPTNGEVVSLSRNGRFVGCSKQLNSHLSLAGNLLDNEKFTVQSKGDKIALKQNVSGLYIGGQIANDRSPILTPNNNDWEQFTLENRGNGVAIKSHFNTYLTQDGNNLKWKIDPQNGSEIWNLVRQNSQNQQGSGQQGFNQGVSHGQGFHQNPSNQGFNSNQSGLGSPSSGDIVTLGQGGKFIGATREHQDQLKLADKPDQWQKYTVETGTDGKISLKQVVSGLYIGGLIANNTRPILVPHNKDWERFAIENRGNGGFAIKSHTNTYLTRANDGLVWKEHPDAGREVWNINVVQHGNQQSNQGFNQGSHLNQGHNQNQGSNLYPGFNQNQGFNQGHGKQQPHNNNQNHGFQGGYQSGFKN